MSATDLYRTSLSHWLQSHGLRDNPFVGQNAEREPDLPDYFVDVERFDELLSLTEPCVVFASRGCGKTAQRRMLAAQCRPERQDSRRLAVHYTYAGFERVLAEISNDLTQLRPIHHVTAILRQALAALKDAARHDSGLEAMTQRPDIAFRLGAYQARYAPGSAPVAVAGGFLSFDYLAASDLLTEFARLIADCGLATLVILLDGLDEFPPMAGDPVRMAAFLAPLLGTLPLIECPGVAFKFFLPQEAEAQMRLCPWFRPDRLHIFRITWTDDKLRGLISQRLTFFSSSGRTYTQLGQLCRPELSHRIDKELVALAEGLPRAALALADLLLRTHCQAANPPELIAPETWEAVKVRWNARKMDFLLGNPFGPISADRTASDDLVVPTFLPSSWPALILHEEDGRVWVGEHEITTEINAQDFRVLVCLYQHRNAVCSKDLLVAQAWPEAHGGEGVTDQAIAAAIARLRKNLGQPAPERGYIETVKGRGYRLHPKGFGPAD